VHVHMNGYQLPGSSSSPTSFPSNPLVAYIRLAAKEGGGGGRMVILIRRDTPTTCACADGLVLKHGGKRGHFLFPRLGSLRIISIPGNSARSRV
jgi:hypothetical protein